MISLRRSQVRIPLAGALATLLFLSLLALITRISIRDLTYRDIDDELETLSVAIASDLETEGISQMPPGALHNGVERNVLAFRLEHHSAMLVDGHRILASTGDLVPLATFEKAASLRRHASGTFTLAEPFTGQQRRCRFRITHLGGAARGNTLIVLRSIEPISRTLWRLDLALLLVVTIGVLGSATILAIAVRRSLQPVEEVTRIAEAAQATDLSRRVALRGGGGEEVERLASVINSLFERLERAFASQRRLVSDAAHELKTPVAVIVAEAQEALRDDTHEEQRRELLESIVIKARSLARETNDLLLLARGDGPRSEREEVDLRDVVDTCHAAIGQLIHERGMTCVLKAQGNTVIRGEESGLRRLVSNLFVNAVRYSDEGADLTVDVDGSGDAVTLTIGDRGPGIDPADRERIFQRFVRLPAARLSNPDSSGLGLAIAEQVARNHDASITIADREGGGSLFVVTFPR
jgi:signal transduction histidine kinase